MYNMNRKLRKINDNYYKLRGELERCLQEAITSDKDLNVMMGFTSTFKPVIYNIDPVMEVDYYDDIIYTVRNSGLCLMEWFDNDLRVIGDILDATYTCMRAHAAYIMDKTYDDVSYDDVLIAIDTPLTNEKLLKERKRIILETYDFKKMATNILDTYLNFLKINFREVD